jgi:SAM-dependent methyltransferase
MMQVINPKRTTLAVPILHVLERLNNFRWETQLGIATRGIVGIDKPDSCHYSTVNYSITHRVLERLSLQASDIFVDVGCGKGRVLCCAARYPCRKVVGVEYSKDLCQEARSNLRRMRGRQARAIVHNTLAETFYYAGATVLYFFNPFGAATLDAALNKIAHDRCNGIRLAFVNGNAVHDTVFAEHAWLSLYDYWSVERGAGQSVAFYRS